MARNTKPVGVAYADPDFDSLSIAGTVFVSGAPGTATANTTVVLGANKNLDVLALPVGGLAIGSGAGTATTVTAAEVNTLHDEVASMTTTATPATGSNAVQFVLKNAAGVAISTARLLHWFVSDVNGVPATAVTSVVTLTNGVIVTTKTGAVGIATTSAAGLLGATLTMTTGSYYLSFVLPNGTIITSSVLTVN